MWETVWRQSIWLVKTAAKQDWGLGGGGAARWRSRVGTRWRAEGAHSSAELRNGVSNSRSVGSPSTVAMTWGIRAWRWVVIGLLEGLGDGVKFALVGAGVVCLRLARN